MNIGINNRATPINQIFVGVNNVAKLVYQAGGGSGSFELPTFTGSSSIFGDITSGRIELYESGTLTLSPGTYDFFAVGGGAGGRTSSDNDGIRYGGGGGGAGYTATISAYEITASSNIAVQIGAGGAQNSNGNDTKADMPNGTNIITANAGLAGAGSGVYGYRKGGKGGSGGGSGHYIGGNGGSDGSNGGGAKSSSSGSITESGGSGQGTTTRMFGESGSTLYAGGGGGSGEGSSQVNGTGGEGGGGNSGQYATAGTTNTGGGGGGGDYHSFGAQTAGAGGSGIMVVRWNNA